MMFASSVRKIGFAGIAATLLLAGLAISSPISQAAGTGAPITLLQSPALGSLSSLGGVSGYIDSQSDGNVNGWLSGQGIDPSAAGPITDTAIPDQAQGKVTVNGSSASLSADATGVNVGYLVGDAMGSENLSTSLSNLVVAPGHTGDAYQMTTDEYLAWMNGTTWQGHYSMGLTNFNFTVSWSMSGMSATPSPDNEINRALLTLFLNYANNTLASPSTIPLSSIVEATPGYQLQQSFDTPYSFAYAVNQALTPGGTVSVDPSQVISQSWLDGLNTSDQTSGVLTGIPLSAWMSDPMIQSLSQVDGLSDISGSTTTAALMSMIVANLTLQGEFNDWASDLVISQVQAIFPAVNSAGSGFTLDPLSAAAQAKIQQNTPTVMSMFIDDGFADVISQGVSASVNVNATLDPGTVTHLTPTGVTAAPPVEVNTDASTLSLSEPAFNINPLASCSGQPGVTPSSITAAATVIDTTGAPVSGATVTFGVGAPLVLTNPVATTNQDGVATMVIPAPTQSVGPGTVQVSAHVGFGSGADLTPASLTITPAYTVSPAPAVFTVVPTGDSPVVANGEDSYTAQVSFKDICGAAQAGTHVTFSVTGSAQLSQTSAVSGEDGVARVTLTDTIPEQVTVTASSPDGQVDDPAPSEQIGDPVIVEFAPAGCSDPQCLASPTPSESPSETDEPTDHPTDEPIDNPTDEPTDNPTDEPTDNPTDEPTDTTTDEPIDNPTDEPTDNPTPCTDDLCVAPAPVGGTLTVDPILMTSGATTTATATVVDAHGQPVPNVAVRFRIGGNAQFVGDSDAPDTDANGQTTVTLTTDSQDCTNQGFDVYASITVSDQVIALSGSPAHAIVIPSPDVCGTTPVALAVSMANASFITGEATPGVSVSVVTSAGTALGTAGADPTGYWYMPTPAGTPSQQITATVVNSSGTTLSSITAWLDTDAPAPARIDQANTHQVAGNVGAVEAQATLTIVFPDQTMMSILANADGSYVATTPPDMPEGQVTVTVTDTAGNSSAPTTVNLIAYVEPASTITVSVKSARVEVTGQQTVTGTGFRYHEKVTAQLCSTTCTTVATGYAGLTGKVTLTFTVPSKTALGAYTVTLTGPTSGTGSASFQVIAPAAPPVTKACAYLVWWAKWWWLFD